MNYIKAIFVILTTLIVASGCNKDKTPSIEVSQQTLYFAAWGAPAQTVSFSATNTVRVAMVSITEGFECTIDNTAKKITVTPKGKTDGTSNDDLSKSGTLHVNALSKSGVTTGMTIYLYICNEIKLDENGQRANCYVITKPNIKYTFEANVAPNGAALNTKSVELLWQSDIDIIDNVALDNGNATFFVHSSDNDTSKVPNTNGVIAAYDAEGDIIWSWHIWITDSDPTQDAVTDSQGNVFMARNLGAYTNSNASNDTQKIYDSYGLYYQWGRKDPFPRPQSYDCSGGVGEIIYDDWSIYYPFQEVEDTSSHVGTIDFATENPMCYITNEACIEEGGDGVGDWLATADNALWKDSEKTTNDPCPYGWKVPSASDLAVLQLTAAEDNTDLDTARKQYGWWLSDGTNSFFYNACGYRRYNDGMIENMNSHDSYPSIPEPWEGHYWTSTANSDGSAMSLYFDLTTTRTINKFQSNKPSRRANGMQVRCVKVK